MPKWMTKCFRCHEVVSGEHVLLIGADGIVKTMYCIPCFIAANLARGQLADAVSATWGGKQAPAREGDVSDLGMAGKRAVTVEEYDGEGTA